MDIHSITTSDQLELHLIYEPPSAADGLVLLGTHGVDSNFYNPPYLQLGRRLRQDGYGYAILNNRGHDRINRVGSHRLGSAYEVFEDCVLDIQAAVDWLVERGHRRVVLSGHSLGALKVTYAQVHQPHPAVIALAPCSGPPLVEDYAPEDLQVWLQEAQGLVSSGRGQELIWARPPADRPGPLAPFSAATYVNKYAPEANTRILQYVDKVKVPSLFIAGAKEERFAKHARDLHAALNGKAPSSMHIIEGATHYYTENEEAVAQVFRDWLKGLA